MKYEDVAEPEISPSEVLVNVKACALNHLDIWLREGLPGIKIPLPHILGADISGIIAETGSEVMHVKKGDEVLLSPGLSCGVCSQCLSGRDNICRYYSIIGYMTDGGYAEYVKAPAGNAIPIPEGLNFNEAAAVPLVFLTAWHMIVGRAKLKPGEDILIHAAGSGVGSAAVQIAKLFGARVIATAGSDEKLNKAGELGADDVINYTKSDFLEEVRRITGKKGVEVVIEHVGPATWEKSMLSLAKNGRLVTCGATTGPVGKIDFRYLFSKHLTIYGSYMGTKGELLEVLKFFPRKKLKPVIDTVLSLKEAGEAHRLMEDRRQFGKIVLNP